MARIGGNPAFQGGGGNPAGRPGGFTGSIGLAKKVRELVGHDGERMLKVLIDIAEYGESESARMAAANSVLDRGFGKAVQPVEIQDESAARVLNLIGMPPEDMEQLHSLLGKALAGSKAVAQEQKQLESSTENGSTGSSNASEQEQQNSAVEDVE